MQTKIKMTTVTNLAIIKVQDCNIILFYFKHLLFTSIFMYIILRFIFVSLLDVVFRLSIYGHFDNSPSPYMLMFYMEMHIIKRRRFVSFLRYNMYKRINGKDDNHDN